MAQGVGRDGLLDARHFRLPLHHYKNHHAREVVASAVEENVILFAGFNLQAVAVDEPALELGYRPVGNWHETFLVALARDTHEMFIEVKVRELEVDKFRHSQPTREEHLYYGAVALTLVAFKIDAVFQPVDLLGGEVGGQVFWKDWRLKQLGGVNLKETIESKETVKRPHAKKNARLRTRANGILVERGGKLLQIVKLHLKGRQMALGEKPHEIGQVVAVSLLRVHRIVAVKLEITHETTHKVVGQR